MNSPPQPAVTERQYQLACRVLEKGIEIGSQLIADSEARATELWRTQVEELRGALALGQKNCDDVFDDLREERDQLRAELLSMHKTACEAGTVAGKLRDALNGLTGVKDRAVKSAIENKAEADALRAEVERLKAVPPTASCGELSCDECNARTAALEARAERAEAELATERARLDSGQIMLIVAGERVWHSGVDLRAAIDAGMREGAK